MSLKELTHEAHRNAETQPFVKILFSGKINPDLYAAYLKNQHPCYEILEVCAMPHGLLNNLPDMRRAPAILEDYLELERGSNNVKISSLLEASLLQLYFKREKFHLYINTGDHAGIFADLRETVNSLDIPHTVVDSWEGFLKFCEEKNIIQ
jgi:hypothetical protein